MQPQNIPNEEWRYLIILDACRFDKFKKFAPAFFKGKLELRDAAAIWTLEWLVNTFQKRYDDIAYVSAVWWCNSLQTVERKPLEFKASKHFAKIYDAWRHCWNEDKHAVLPWDLNRMTRKAIAKHPEWRFIIHYQQPHTPYLSIETQVSTRRNQNTMPRLPVRKILTRQATRTYQRIFGIESLWRTFQRFGMKPRTHMEAAWRTVGRRGVVELYEMNLLTVMNSAKHLITNLPPGKVIITSDHGELLGEQRWWGHGYPKPRILPLIGVPWFEVDRDVDSAPDQAARISIDSKDAS